MTNPQIILSPNKCFKAFDQSFNRIKYFSCIADNISESSFPTEWFIQNNPTGLSYGMKKPTEDNYLMLVNGFKYYMQRYLTRDCIENFSLCLDELFFILLANDKTIPHGKKLLECLSEEELKLFTKFNKVLGLEKKVELLEKHFNISILPDHKKIITSLKDIRNCLSHNNGIVRETDGEEDPTDNQKRKFHWAVFKFFTVGKSGTQFSIEFGKPLPEESEICMKQELQNHYKSFQIYHPLSFSSADTYEIALSLQLIALRYLDGVSKIINQNQQPK
jgi:hypothetical protein